MSLHDDLPALFLLVALTVVGPMTAVRLRLPAAVVLILAGIGAGPAGIGWVRETPTVAFVSELGFLVLMFVAGMEIDFAGLRRAGARVLVSPVLTVAGCFAIAAAFGAAFGLRPVEVLVLSAMSVGMPLAVLHESGAVRQPLGRHVVLTVSLGEFASILAVTGLEIFAGDEALAGKLVRLAKIALLFAVSGLAVRWARALVWWHPGPFRRLVRHHDVAELGVRVGLLVMLGFVVMAAILGVEAILGAFLAGALVSIVLHEKRALEDKIAALGHGLFIPVFFVVVGVRFAPELLDLAAVRDALVLVAIAAVVKLVPALAFAPRELGLVDRIASGCLLAAPLTLVVAIAAIGRELGLISPRREASFVLVAVLVSIVFPVLFRRVRALSPRGEPVPAEEPAA